MTRYEIKISSVKHNAEEVKRRAGVPVWGVIKFDGYSLGLEFMAKTLQQSGIDRFAVIDPFEAEKLREAEINSDILLMRPVASDSEIRDMLSLNVILSVGSEDYLARVAEEAKKQGKTARVHIQADTGYSRYGFTPEEYRSIRRAYETDGVCVEGIFSHFSSAFRSEETTREQYEKFMRMLDRLKADGIERGMAHICNSPALYCYEDMRLDAVRIGSAFLGRVGATSEDAKRLERVGILKSEIVEIRKLRAGSAVGYNGDIILESDTRAAVVPFGLRDGLNSGITYTMVRTASSLVKAPLIGAPSIGHIMLDVTHTDIAVGDEVRVDFNPLFLNSSVKKEYI